MRSSVGMRTKNCPLLMRTSIIELSSSPNRHLLGRVTVCRRSLLIPIGTCTPFLVLSRGGDRMPCSNPSLAYFPIDRKTGRRSKKLAFVHSVVGWEREFFDMSVSFIRNHEFAEPYLIPCGKCLHCLMMRARDWSFRCQCEYETMGSALFLTLTYNDEHLPLVDGVPSLQRRDMQLFLKSLRKRFDGQRLSYFGCGEYGGNGFRPHYHIMVFGLSLDDLVLWKRSAKGFVLFRSATIESLWSRGFSTVEPCTSRTIDYVTRYSLKKASQDFSSFPVRPFTACSKRPAIGLGWFNSYGRGLVKFDSDGKVVDASVLFRGTPMPLPRYFLKRFGLSGDEVLVNGLEDYRRSYRNFEDFSDLSSGRLLRLDDLSTLRFSVRSSQFDSLSIPDVSASADNARYESRTQGGGSRRRKGESILRRL